MSTVPLIELGDGNRIAQLGFSTYQIEPDDTWTAAKTAELDLIPTLSTTSPD